VIASVPLTHGGCPRESVVLLNPAHFAPTRLKHVVVVPQTGVQPRTSRSLMRAGPPGIPEIGASAPCRRHTTACVMVVAHGLLPIAPLMNSGHQQPLETDVLVVWSALDHACLRVVGLDTVPFPSTPVNPTTHSIPSTTSLTVFSAIKLPMIACRR